MNHKEYFHSGKVAIKVNNVLEHVVLNNLYAVDGVKVKELFDPAYPYRMVEDPNGDGLAITSYGAVSPRAKASFDSVLHFLATPAPQFKTVLGNTEVTIAEDGNVVFDFGYNVDHFEISGDNLDAVVKLKKEFDNFHDVG